MNILVAKNGSQLGPFSESDIRAKLASGEFAPTDFGWKEGMAAWTPLSQMFADAPAPGPVVAPAPYTPPQEQNAPSPYQPQPQGQPYSQQPYNAPQGQYSAPQNYNSPYPSPYQPGAVQQWGAPGAVVYAGFWLRAVALLIDFIVLLVVNFCVGLVLGIILSVGGGISRDGLNVLSAIIGHVVFIIYFTLMESSSAQATVGKMVLGLKVTDLGGNRIGFGKALGRNLGKYISSFILLVGFFMAGFTQYKQALHDLMAGTLVVKK